MQTIQSVVVELQPQSAAPLREQIDALKQKQHNPGVAYGNLKAAVPLLHFMSMTIFPDDQYDPVLVIEVNFDGPAGPFWGQFERAFGEDLRAILRCGKVPRDERADLFVSVTREGSTAPIAPLLEALTIQPAVGHQGNRGLERARIEAEGALFAAVQAAIDGGALPKDATPGEIHGGLRKTLLPSFAWLDEPSPPRIGAGEKIVDLVNLIVFAVAVLFVLLLPGVLASLALGPIGGLVVLVAAGLWLGSRPGSLSGLAKNVAAPSGKLLAVAGALVALAAVFAAIAAFLASFHHWRPERFDHHFGVWAAHFGLGLVGLWPTIAGLLLWIRRLEMRDPPQDAPPRDEVMLRAMARREDKIVQNHMGSVVHLKPGVLRAILVPVAMRALGLVLRVKARDGYLGSMRTIHFAHWALISNRSRLLFFSNFDGSWESYLDDFIEKAHAGLTLAWTSGIGFPPTRYLVLDGATQGRKFKAWARHSMAESLFWYSAYIDFTVNQIERQWRVAEGLRQASLNEEEAAAWAMDL